LAAASCRHGRRETVADHASRSSVERVTGIEPALSAWEADVLPLNYTRGWRSDAQNRPPTGSHSTEAAPDPPTQ
jgi:hypothetical protein